MSGETIALIMTALAGIAAAVKAVAEARKAKYEAAARIAEAERADEAEKTTDAVIKGINKAKATMSGDLARYLQDEIKTVALADGVEEKLNKRVKKIKRTEKLDKNKLLDLLDE
jgi:hypothetical protein